MLLTIEKPNLLYGYFLLVIFIACQRLLEMRRSKQNEEALKARGGQEVASLHFVFMRLLHLTWLIACIVESWWRAQPPPLAWATIAFFFLFVGQVLRLAAMNTLRERWTVRIVILPGEPPVKKGIYNYIRHPNYLGVIIEIAALPMVFGCWITALVFSLANGVLLWVRIRAEEKALEAAGGYQEAFESQKRFLPFS